MGERDDGGMERGYLLVSAGGNLTIGVAGLVFAWLTSSQAILLDGLFNLSYLGAGLFAIKVAGLVRRGDDERFPFGYAFFEPLVNAIKGLLVLGVVVMAVWGAIGSLLAGGTRIDAGLALAYGVFAALVCWAIALVTRHGGKRTKSPLVVADGLNWLVNAAVSTAVALAFLSALLLEGTSLDPMAPYVDPVLVLLVVAISFMVPVRMVRAALMDLLNRTPSPEIARRVTDIVGECTAELSPRETFVRVVQPGRMRWVIAHIVLPGDAPAVELTEADALRTSTLERLMREHPLTFLDMLFTKDPIWGAPGVEKGSDPSSGQGDSPTRSGSSGNGA